MADPPPGVCVGPLFAGPKPRGCVCRGRIRTACRDLTRKNRSSEKNATTAGRRGGPRRPAVVMEGAGGPVYSAASRPLVRSLFFRLLQKLFGRLVVDQFQRRMAGSPCPAQARSRNGVVAAASLSAATGPTPSCHAVQVVSGIPFSGDRSDACVPSHARVVQRHPFQRRQVAPLACHCKTGMSAAFPSAATSRITSYDRNRALVSGMPFSGDRSNTSVLSQFSSFSWHSFQRRQVGHLRAIAIQYRQLHVLQRRQVGHLRVSAVQGNSAACPSAATGRTPWCPSQSSSSAAFLQRRQVGHRRVAAVQSRQLHVLQRRQVGHLRDSCRPGPSASCPSAATGRTPACQLQSRSVSGIPFSGDRSDTGVNAQFKEVVSFISFSGDRSATCVSPQSRLVSFMPFSGDRSASLPFRGSLPRQYEDPSAPPTPAPAKCPSRRPSRTPTRHHAVCRSWASPCRRSRG